MKAFGYAMPAIVAPSARRMKNGDPRVKKNFIWDYEKGVLANQLHIRAFHLQQMIEQDMLNQAAIAEYEELRRLRKLCIEEADRKY